jgi:segregation and condensation protein A
MIPEYQVRLDAFEGPLDLLLYLIRKSEVDLHDIPVGQITHQYLAFLEGAGGVAALDVETAGEFLVMAATLMEIKSRMLMPAQRREEGDGAGEEGRAPEPAADPRAELVRQLMEYKKYRDAAMALESRQQQWEKRFAAAPAYAAAAPAPPADENEAVELEDLTLLDLVAAFTKIIETVDFARVGEHRVLDDETPIHVHAEDLLTRLKRDGGSDRAMYFTEIFRGRSRSECIGLFLAMLELIRYGKLRATQQDRGPIRIALREESEQLAPEAAVV